MLKIYGRQGCPYCEKAKNLMQMLKDQGYFHEASYIDYQELGWSKDELSQVANHPISTVPVVLLNDVYIGGYQELHDRYPID